MIERWPGSGAFHTLLHPHLFGFVRNVHVLRANRATIGAFQNINNIFQRRFTLPEKQVARLKTGIQVRRRQLQVFQFQARYLKRFLQFKRVKFRPQVATAAIAIDQLTDRKLLSFML